MAAAACLAASPRVPRPGATRSARRMHASREGPVVQRLAASANSAGTLDDISISPSPVLIIPGFLSSASKYEAMADCLRQYDSFSNVAIVPLSVSDWYPSLVGGDFSAILDAIDRAATEVLDKSNGKSTRNPKLVLIGHSAGGWLARCWLGSEPYCGVTYNGALVTKTLCTLGTPHYSLEEYPFGRVPEKLDEQLFPKGAEKEKETNSEKKGESVWTAERASQSTLALTNFRYPGCFETKRGIHYVSVCGVGVVGVTFRGLVSETLANVLTNPKNKNKATLADVAASVSYATSCGSGDGVDGDGVTPVGVAVLDGSEELLLPGVTHQPDGTKREMWYGDEDVVKQWVAKLL